MGSTLSLLCLAMLAITGKPQYFLYALLCGYGCAWVADRPSVIATIAAGYADGLPRTLSNQAQLWDGDTPCPLVGRVSPSRPLSEIRCGTCGLTP